MSLHRFYIEPSFWGEADIGLPESVAHHLLHVLRVNAGETVAAFDGRGREAAAQVRREGPRGCVLRVLETRTIPEPALRITLLQAIPKGDRMDVIVEKATELGATAIVPLLTERGVVRPAGEAKREDRRNRWERIAIRAAEQSGAARVPKIEPVDSLEHALATRKGNYDLFLAGALVGRPRPLREVMAEERVKKPSRVALLIGPEGDLTPLELRQAADTGARLVSFGENVFRVETAALYGLSVLKYELGEPQG